MPSRQSWSIVSTSLAVLALVSTNSYAARRTADALGHVVALCSASGIRMVRLPDEDHEKRDDCPKACHALCHRSRERGLHS